MFKKMFISLLILISVVALGAFAYTRTAKFGRPPGGARLARIQKSPHYVHGEFQCLEPVTQIVEGDGGSFTATLKFLFGDKAGLVPPAAVPTQKTDLQKLDPGQDVVVWLGHSSYYMQLGGYKILIDPVLSDYGSPIFLVNKAFAGSSVYTAADFPQQIDVLVMSHDHWDHLDYDAIKALQPRIKNIVCPLGVGEYFEEWGFAPEQLHEEDWNTEVKLAPDLSVHVLPAQHFSGRLLKRNQTEWAGFAFITSCRQVFYSGDGGYGKHFAAIGQQFGGFDLAILEDGQYNKNWPRIHMLPEQVAQAALDVKAKTVLPAHNGKFALSTHDWDEPYKRLAAASAGKNYQLLTPEIGALVRIGSAEPFSPWWETVKK